MLLAIVYERVDKRGRKRYVVKLRYIAPDKTFYIAGGGRRWTHQEVAILVENRHNLDKAAKILGRTKAACQKELERLGLSILRQKEKIAVVFPSTQLDRRKEVLRQSLPGLKTLLKNVESSKDLTPENVNELAKVVRAIAALLNAVEKWQTGEETLEMWRAEVKDVLEDAGEKK